MTRAFAMERRVRWQKAEFKGKQVWAEVDDLGRPKESEGLVRIRYARDTGAKIYRGRASTLVIDPDAGAETLDEEPERSSAQPRGSGSSNRGSGFGKAGTRSEAQAALAQEAAKRLIESLEGAVLVFTDGACRGNPGPAGAGVAIRGLPEGRRADASLALGHATNNIAELSAVDLALDLLERCRVGKNTVISVFTDSAYVHGVLVRGWKAKANQALVARLRSRIAAYPRLTIHWIAGHVGVEGNERADVLANAGVDGRTDFIED